MKIFPSAFIALAFASHAFAVETPLVIDKAHSNIEAGVKSTMDNFSVKLAVYDAIVSVETAEKRIGSAQIKFRFADLKTGKENRDVEMLHWEQTDKFADCVFNLEALLPAADGTFSARGKFTLHGVTKETSFPVTIGFKEPDAYTIDGNLPIDTRDYGLPVIRNFAILKVNPVLQVKFHLEGRVSPGV
jgi:polyisoprenoid-binding protein YceI